MTTALKFPAEFPAESPTQSPAPMVQSFGCRLNIWESEVITRHATAAGLSDVVIVNTCAVTAEAEKQARQAVRRHRRQNPDARIVVTGCSAQINPSAWQAMDGVDAVIGNHEKLQPAVWQALGQTLGEALGETLGQGLAGGDAPDSHDSPDASVSGDSLDSLDVPDAPDSPNSGDSPDIFMAVGDIMAVRETAPHLLEGFDTHTRAFLQIQQGCDHRCTFCIIPYGRGANRSVPEDVIIDHIDHLVRGGIAEIVLTGVDIASWGRDLGGRDLGGGDLQAGHLGASDSTPRPRLGNLVTAILARIPQLKRLRLSSLDPAEIDAELLAALGRDPRLMPHIHLSVQHGDDLILKRMKRRHQAADVLAVVEAVRRVRPDCVFGADLIAGFPTEDDAAHNATLRLIEAAGLTWLHIFPYSPRAGTPAVRMPQVPAPVIRARAAELRSIARRREDAFLAASVGMDDEIVLEAGGIGHTRGFARARLVAGAGDAPPRAGGVYRVRITGLDGGVLEAEII